MESIEKLPNEDLRPDEEIVAAVLGGDIESFEELILRYQPRIFGMARKYFRNESDVEDLVQTIFTKTYKKLGSFKKTAPFEHWFMRLSVNTCYDALRRRTKHCEQAVSDLMFEDESWQNRLDNIPDSEDQESLDKANELVHSVMEQISNKARIVLTMQELEGRSIREISELTGWSISS